MDSAFNGDTLKVWPDAVATLGNDEVLELNGHGIMLAEGNVVGMPANATTRHVAISQFDIVVSGAMAQAVVTSWLTAHPHPEAPLQYNWMAPALPGTTQTMASAPFDKTSLDSLILVARPWDRWAGIRLTWPVLDGTAQPTAVDVFRMDGFLIAHGEYGVTSVPSYGKGSFKRRYTYDIPGVVEDVWHHIYHRT